MRLWVWNPASGRGWLCAFLIQGPGLLVTDVCPTAQTLGGGCRQSALAAVFMLQLLRHPLAAAAPGLSPPHLLRGLQSLL